MLRKFHEAKLEAKESVELWGTGTPLREFLHVDDLAEACYFLMENYDDYGQVNIGIGEDISIKDLALLVKKIVNYSGEIICNSEKPDGTPRKLMDVSKVNQMGWKAKIGLEEGIEKVYKEFFS
jgi:GDP-L-fucose synthase